MMQPGPTAGAKVVDRHLLVIFGATGDLYRRKLLPALYQLLEQYDLVDRCVLLGIAMSDMTEAEFRDYSHDALAEAGHDDVSCSQWCEQVLHFESVDGSEDDYPRLRERIAEIELANDLDGNRIFYLALPPSVFAPAVAAIDSHGLADGEGWKRVVIEKPFGHDLATATELNARIHKHFDEQQIYRIDHYLGKATVQNLLVFRFANSLFESAWNRDRIDNVQITVAESIGIGDRAGYYDSSGAMRDMMQNHVAQVLSLVAMEPPTSFEAESIRDEKVKVLDSIRAIDPDEVVRGQYGRGEVGDEQANSYTEEHGVAEGSTTETYVAARMFIDNWRWQGVPFFVRSGKRLPTRLTQIAVTFRPPPVALFDNFEHDPHESDPSGSTHHGNVLYITLQPHEGFDLLFDVKAPSDTPRFETLPLEFDYESAFGELPGAYETLLFDVMTGDQTLFVRGDEVEKAWSLFEPLLDMAGTPEVYPAGTWGPVAADRLPYDNGARWTIRVHEGRSR